MVSVFFRIAAKSLNFALWFVYARGQTIASPLHYVVSLHLVVHAVFKLAPCRPPWGLPSQL